MALSEIIPEEIDEMLREMPIAAQIAADILTQSLKNDIDERVDAVTLIKRVWRDNKNERAEAKREGRVIALR